MVKWFVYIVFLLVFTPCILLAKIKAGDKNKAITTMRSNVFLSAKLATVTDTIKALKSTSKPDTKVKEVAKAKRQPKPEKVDETGQAAKKEKPKRQRRPDGMERPPEIPRRNDN